MSKIIQLSLTETDIDLLIDGLCVRQKAWQQTAMLMRGEQPGDPSVCEDCDDVEEAEGFAAHYSQIIRKIVEQLDSQSMASELEG